MFHYQLDPSTLSVYMNPGLGQYITQITSIPDSEKEKVLEYFVLPSGLYSSDAVKTGRTLITS